MVERRGRPEHRESRPHREGRARPYPRSRGGFTVLEIMVALTLGTVGLLGTVAVQQTMFNGSATAGDAAIATRLAMRAMDEYDAKVVTAGPPVVDQLAAVAAAGCSAPSYLNPLGSVGTLKTADFRFRREVRVTTLGSSQPYNVSVQITYALDAGTPKIVRLDSQRSKTW
jgi:hypothetical protein